MLRRTNSRRQQQQGRAAVDVPHGRVPFAPSLDENSSPTQPRKPRLRDVASRYKAPARSSSSTPSGTSSSPLQLGNPASPTSNQGRARGSTASLGQRESAGKGCPRGSKKDLEQAENEKPRDNILEQPSTIRAAFSSTKAVPMSTSVNLSSMKELTCSRKPQTPSSSRAASNAGVGPKYMSQSVNGSLGPAQRWSSGPVKNISSHRKPVSSPAHEALRRQEPSPSDTTPVTKTCEYVPVRPKSPFRVPSPGKLSSPPRAFPSPPSSRPSSSHGCRPSPPVKRAAAEQDEAQLLRLLHNRYLQWRFVNARAEAAIASQEAAATRLLFNAWACVFDLRTVVAMQQIKLDKARRSFKLASVLESQKRGLDKWSRLEDELPAALEEMARALNTDVLRVPLCRGAKADPSVVHGVVHQANVVMDSVKASVAHLLSKIQEQSFLAQELAEIVALEKASVRQLRQTLGQIASLEVEERSLTTHCIQLRLQKKR